MFPYFARLVHASVPIFLREDGPGVDDVQAIWTLLFVPLVRCRTRPIRVLFSPKADADKSVVTGNLAMITGFFSVPPTSLVPSMTVLSWKCSRSAVARFGAVFDVIAGFPGFLRFCRVPGSPGR